MKVGHISCCWVLVLGLLTSCGREDAGARDRQAAGTATPGRTEAVRSFPVRVSLVERHPVADEVSARSRVGFGPEEPEPWTFWGWHSPDPDGTWTLGSQAVLQVPVLHQGPLELRLHLAAETEWDDKPLPPQRVRLTWNGHPLGLVTLEEGRATPELRIPASLQAIGWNQLSLLPSFWVQRERGRRALKEEGVGVRVESLELRRVRTEALGGACRVEGATLWQPCGQLVHHALVLPQDARLTGRVRLESPLEELPEGLDGHAMLRLQDEEGGEQVVWERSLRRLFEKRDGWTLDEALTGSGAASLYLVFSVHAEAPVPAERAALFTLAWEELAVEGTERRTVAAAPAAERRPSVLMVLFDSLRADDVGPYGGLAETPVLDDLARRGVVLEDAVSVTSWTRPSVATLFTGQHPDVHQVLTSESLLPESVPLLSEALRAAGYRTLSLVTNSQVSPELGFGRGFDQAHRLLRKDPEADAPEEPGRLAAQVWDEYLEPFLAADEDAPVFFYLHEIDPHAPYDPPPPFDQRYLDGEAMNQSGAKKITDLMNLGVMPLDDMDVAYLRAQYRGEITFMDRYLGEILERWWDAFGEDSLVVFLSDHGEEFLDHDAMRHGRTLYEESIRVPLILAGPATLPAGVRARVPANLVDVAPTVLELLGLPVPEGMQGTSLAGDLWAGDAWVGRRPVFSVLDSSERRRLESVRLGPWKLVRTQVNDHVRWELFHRERDPGERRDLCARRPVRAHALHQLLRQHRRDNQRRVLGPARTIDLQDMDPEMLEDLRALGYLAGDETGGDADG